MEKTDRANGKCCSDITDVVDVDLAKVNALFGVFLCELLEDWCYLFAWWAPVSVDVNNDDTAAGDLIGCTSFNLSSEDRCGKGTHKFIEFGLGRDHFNRSRHGGERWNVYGMLVDWSQLFYTPRACCTRIASPDHMSLSVSKDAV